MAEETMKTTAEEFDVDARWTVFTGILYGVLGGMSFIVQPGFVQGMTNYLGFSDAEAGYAISAEMIGFSAMTIILVFLSSRVNWRQTLRGLLCLIILGNVCAIFSEGFTAFAASRFVAGLGCGGIVSLGFAMVGMTSKPDRNFGLMIVASMIYGAVVLYCMPMFFEQFGMQGLLVFFGLFAVVGLFFVPNAPLGAEEQQQVEEDAVDLPWKVKGLALVAMLLFFLAQGAVWAYLGLMGETMGSDEQQVANALTLSQFPGILGALGPILLGAKFGRLPPLMIAMLASVTPLVYYLFGAAGVGAYLVMVLIYNFGFNLAHPYLLATMASFDRTGKVVVYAVALQTVGLAVGPALAALVVGGGNYGNVALLGIIFFTAALVFIAPPALAQRRHSLANSSEAGE